MSKLKNKIKTIENQLNEVENAKKEIQTQFFECIKEIFIKYPELDLLEFSVNNHEFNDESPTFFCIYYEDAQTLDKTGEFIENEGLHEDIQMLFYAVDQIDSFMFEYMYQESVDDSENAISYKRTDVLKN
jgi:hypothetical protein